MASNINDTGVNKDYPVAGQDNDSPVSYTHLTLPTKA